MNDIYRDCPHCGTLIHRINDICPSCGRSVEPTMERPSERRRFDGGFLTEGGLVKMVTRDGELVMTAGFDPPEGAHAFVANVRRDQELCDLLLFLHDQRKTT